jgi:class 3 adenylate cyclase
MPSVRRLTAILAADVAGYSRLMGADEEGTHERLKAHLGELVNPKIKEHHGRIVKNTGDGLQRSVRGAGPFSDRIESSVPSAVLQVLRWGRRSTTLRSVFAAHGPTSCFSPTRTGVLADLSRCKPLPGIAVNGALYPPTYVFLSACGFAAIAAIATAFLALPAGSRSEWRRWKWRRKRPLLADAGSAAVIPLRVQVRLASQVLLNPSYGGPRVRIRLPPAARPVRTQVFGANPIDGQRMISPWRSPVDDL